MIPWIWIWFYRSRRRVQGINVQRPGAHYVCVQAGELDVISDSCLTLEQ